ncbi:MAG: hypothetical protein PVF08_03930 [Gammaproteobacteria bacterium]|jgi:hypothetical protein
MHKGRHTFRKPDTLMLLAVSVVLAVLITTAADATGDAFRPAALTDLQNGDVQVVRLGRHGSGVHLSLQPPHAAPDIHAARAAVVQPGTVVAPNLFLNLRIPW